MTITLPRAATQLTHARRLRLYRRQFRLPLMGDVTLPPPGQLAYFAGLGLLAAVEVIEWPLALVIAAGHLLADQHWSRALRGLGAAAEEA
ncbi:hypothetical protein GCM10023322_11290 [Rugosimonospora acidiphila]|uniref:Uncharacterized protein n=1 Tax=Rugosimonospora acidiphila TaxID=556531 RepID=A0ABP9RMS8_9ACTN